MPSGQTVSKSRQKMKKSSFGTDNLVSFVILMTMTQCDDSHSLLRCVPYAVSGHIILICKVYNRQLPTFPESLLSNCCLLYEDICKV